MDDGLPTAKEIIVIHEEIEEAYDLKYTGAMKAAPRLKLDRALNDVRAEDTVLRRAAMLLWKIQSVHVFNDANKRTAWTATRKYLQRNGIEPAEKGELAERVTRRAGAFTAEEVATFLETGKIDESRLGP